MVGHITNFGLTSSWLLVPLSTPLDYLHIQCEVWDFCIHAGFSLQLLLRVLPTSIIQICVSFYVVRVKGDFNNVRHMIFLTHSHFSALQRWRSLLQA